MDVIPGAGKLNTQSSSHERTQSPSAEMRAHDYPNSWCRCILWPIPFRHSSYRYQHVFTIHGLTHGLTPSDCLLRIASIHGPTASDRDSRADRCFSEASRRYSSAGAVPKIRCLRMNQSTIFFHRCATAGNGISRADLASSLTSSNEAVSTTLRCRGLRRGLSHK